ncbi:spore germination protein [Neobacillus mesonae]|uniref:spore germination protein n=1 Tax=Neobacillus mesonae TaxID=1193713 RepID=UPI0025740290|nr:spore germination protein [Neobacillus mesonae]MED4205050.1 spore germination protein [Neobacillus mesonae]
MVFFTPLAVNLLGFKVNAIDNSSVINFGPLAYVDQFVSYKRNQAVGEQNGDFSPINIPISSVIDPDIADSPSAKNSII